MIKVNLLPIKKKKKSKPIPGFLVALVALLLVSAVVMGYLTYNFSSRINERKDRIAKNTKRIEELTNQIKSVENFEKLNQTFQKNKDIIEQLGKNKTIPVKIMDELSAQLPPGIWFTSLEIKNLDLTIRGEGFTNSDVVAYVTNLKKSAILSDVYLQETVQGQTAGTTTYTFRITCKGKI